MTSGTEIRRVLGTGRRERRDNLDILWAPNQLTRPRLGLVVPRLGQTAVARNRLRRRLKELWRKDLQHILGPLDVVIRARAQSYRANWTGLRTDLLGWATGLGQVGPKGRGRDG